MGPIADSAIRHPARVEESKVLAYFCVFFGCWFAPQHRRVAPTILSRRRGLDRLGIAISDINSTTQKNRVAPLAKRGYRIRALATAARYRCLDQGPQSETGTLPNTDLFIKKT